MSLVVRVLCVFFLSNSCYSYQIWQNDRACDSKNFWKIYHSLYLLFRHKNVLCTKEAFSEPQYGGKCPLVDVKKLLFTSYSTMCYSENLTSVRANVLPEAVLGTLDFFLKQSDIQITILST